MSSHSLWESTLLLLIAVRSRAHWSKNHIVDYLLPRPLGVVMGGRQLVACRGVCKWKTTSIMQERSARDGDTLVRILFKKYAWSCTGLQVGCGTRRGGAVRLPVSWTARGMIEIQMASWQSICKLDCGRSVSRFTLTMLCSACQAHKTEIESRPANKPSHNVQL